MVSLRHKISVSALNGQSLPEISLSTIPITLITSGNHSETITFLITNSPLAPVVLGHPWLTQHNPRVDWGHNTISEWSKACYASCLVSAGFSVSCSLLQDEMGSLSNVPEEYLDLKEVFSKSRAASLPPHRPYDCAIELVPGMSPPKGRLYSLSVPEREAMGKYISDSLTAGIIRPSSSPAGVGFFFAAKKDGSLRPCIDYPGLNNITVKNTYPTSSGTFLHMFWECPVVISLWTHVNLVLSSLLRIDWSVNPSLCLLNDDSGLCISSMQKRMLFAGFTAVKKTIIQNWFTPHMCREAYWIRSLLQIVSCECTTARVGGARPSTIEAWQCFLLNIHDYLKE